MFRRTSRAEFSSVLITGASSGLGAALATAHARQGVVLHLFGRNAERLGAATTACRERGANVLTYVVDVRDTAGMHDAISSAHHCVPLDLVYINAGVSAGTGASTETQAQAEEIFAVNLQGALNSFYPALACMQAQRRGTVVFLSSMAALLPVSSAPAYSASKAFIVHYAESMRDQCAACGVRLSVVYPGFIDTPMTRANPFPMPFLMDAKRAAQCITHAVSCGKPRLYFPFMLYLLICIFKLLPSFVRNAVFRSLPSKPHKI